MAKKTQKRVSPRQAPIGVKILSVLGYIGAVLTLILGLIMIFGGGAIASFLSTQIPMLAAGVVGVGLVIAGIIFVALAVLDYFIARGLWNGQNWARILLIIFLVLGILGSLSPFGIIQIIIYALLIWYVGFSKEVKSFFR